MTDMYKRRKRWREGGFAEESDEWMEAERQRLDVLHDEIKRARREGDEALEAALDAEQLAIAQRVVERCLYPFYRPDPATTKSFHFGSDEYEALRALHEFGTYPDAAPTGRPGLCAAFIEWGWAREERASCSRMVPDDLAVRVTDKGHEQLRAFEAAFRGRERGGREHERHR